MQPCAMIYGPVFGTDKISDGYKRLLNSAMCSNPTGRTIVAKCVSTGIHKGLECNTLWDYEDGTNENTCRDQNPILVTAPLPVTTLSSMTTGGTIFRFETVEESNEQTTMTGTNG